VNESDGIKTFGRISRTCKRFYNVLQDITFDSIRKQNPKTTNSYLDEVKDEKRIAKLKEVKEIIRKHVQDFAHRPFGTYMQFGIRFTDSELILPLGPFSLFS